jgi:hypothetical protein
MKVSLLVQLLLVIAIKYEHKLNKYFDLASAVPKKNVHSDLSVCRPSVSSLKL